LPITTRHLGGSAGTNYPFIKYDRIHFGMIISSICATWDETWVDTHHTASHQWTPPNPSDARKIPLNKGQRFVILHAGCKTISIYFCIFKTKFMQSFPKFIF
jgi:hypothetical protein